jgi:hypothetical protein
MSTFKVCTYHINVGASDPQYKSLCELSTKVNRKYCELNNYEYTYKEFDETVLENFCQDGIFELESLKSKTWIYKYQFILDTLNSSTEDYIVFVESDSIFVNPNNKLENYIDTEHDIFYAASNWSWDLNDYMKNISSIRSIYTRTFC